MKVALQTPLPPDWADVVRMREIEAHPWSWPMEGTRFFVGANVLAMLTPEGATMYVLAGARVAEDLDACAGELGFASDD